MTVDNWKKVEATYHQGLRCIHAETNYTQLKYGTRTNLGLRQKLQAATIQQVVSSRRFVCFQEGVGQQFSLASGLHHRPDAPRGWTKEVRKDLGALAKFEVGVTPTDIQIISQAKDTTKQTM